MNFTVIVPEGTTDHGSQNLLCVRPSWHEYLTFFIVNYVVHATTLASRPGAALPETLYAVVSALFVPGVGVLTAVWRLRTHAATTRKDQLRRAAKAGALVMVAKQKHFPQFDFFRNPEWGPPYAETQKVTEKNDSAKIDELQASWFEKTFQMPLSARIVHRQRSIYGLCDLPRAYCLVEVPPDTPLKGYSPPADIYPKDINLASSHNIPKVLVGLIQALIGVVTLYKAQGNQIDIYGYAAFGLSAAPYAFMSLLNILTALVTPEYPSMYLVHTPDLDEACKDGGRFGGVIAAVDTEAVETPMYLDPDEGDEFAIWFFLIAFFLALAPIAIVGALSKFQAATSTASQRGWMMSWLVVGSASSVWMRVVAKNIPQFSYWEGVSKSKKVFSAVFLAIYTLPWICGIGGMVTVGLMIKEYGVCTRLDL